MAVHYPSDLNIFALVRIEDPQCSPKDKKLIQIVSDKIEQEFIATAEDDLTLTAILDLEQVLGREIKWVTGVTYDHLLKRKGMFGGGVDGPGRLPSWARRYCTSELKLVPIFEYVHQNILKSDTDKVRMGIGYRADEIRRKTNFQSTFHYPIACSLNGIRKRVFKDFNWREGWFPLIDDKITHFDIIKFWRNYSIEFPKQSNCIGCFHKDELSLNLQWKNNPAKMQGFADMEKIGKGTWRDNRITYEQIKAWRFSEELSFEQAGTCDSGGCTD